MSRKKGSSTFADNESPFTSSSQAAYRKPSGDNQQGPSKRNSQGISSFSLGSENDNNQNNFVSSNSVSYGNGQPKAAPPRKDISSSDLANVSNFVTTNSSSYGSPTGPRKQNKAERSDLAAGSNNVNVGRYATGSTRNTSSDNVLASYGSGSSLQQGQGQGQGSAQNNHSSSFVTSNAAAFGSSVSSSRSNSNSNNDNNNTSAFQSSNSSYGKVNSERSNQQRSDAPAGASFGRSPQAARAESGNFQIGFSTDSSFATSSSVAFSKPLENKERLQNHNRPSIRSTPTDSDNPLGPTHLNQGILPLSSSSTSASSLPDSSSSSSSSSSRQISEKHRQPQRSSFNPITGE